MIYLSASRMADYKDCPTLYKFPVIDRVYPDIEATPLRMGTNYHSIQEVIGKHIGDADVTAGIMNLIDEAYAECPTHITMEDWLTERNTLLYTAWAYTHHYNDSNVEVVESEMKFELPLLHPETGRALPNVRVRGIIDKIVNYPDRGLFIREYKSTSDSVEDGSAFWPNLRMALQPSIYYDAAKRLGYDIQGIEYDVWHKPTIRPKFLTQKDTKELFNTQKYLGGTFEVEDYRSAKFAADQKVLIGEERAEIKEGKQGFAVKETSRMFGVRLYEDIQERPDFYFNRREISRTDDDMETFRWELYCTYQTVKNMIKSGRWFKNEKHCERMGKCRYTPICYNKVNVDECIPDGFRKKEIVKEQ